MTLCHCAKCEAGVNVRLMANTFPKRWTETFQMRVDAQFKKDVEAIAKARGLPAGADAIRELVAQEVAQLARKAQPKR